LCDDGLPYLRFVCCDTVSALALPGCIAAGSQLISGAIGAFELQRYSAWFISNHSYQWTIRCRGWSRAHRHQGRDHAASRACYTSQKNDKIRPFIAVSG
jgi:hypothetical protein